ncbi:MAG: tyrosine-type recombinase/integrase [Desulfitobacteriaceae bacterium]|nr:tyrosine-type recombinase/integrase [Desulfitobacteriaceae bacterium]
MTQDFLKEYRSHLLNSGKSRNTIYAYMAPLRQFEKWLAESTGEFSPRYWTREWAGDFLAWLSRRRGETTVGQAVKALRLFFKWAAGQGLISTYNVIEEKFPKQASVFDQGFTDWLRGKSENTVRSYNAHVRQFADWFREQTGEPFGPEKVTSLDVNNYLLYLKGRSKKPATINSMMFAVRAYCNYAAEAGLIKENPFSRLSGITLQLEAKKTRWLDNKEQYDFLRKVEEKISRRGYLEYAVILTMLDAGLRESEVCNLKLENVVLYPVKEARIEVLHSKWNRSRTVPIASTPKGEGKRLHKALKAYLEERSKRGADTPWFFLSSRGEKLSPKVVQGIVRRYRGSETKITPHVLRHTFGHNLVQGGMLLHEVAELMGHMRADGSPNVQSVVIYTMPSEQEKRRKINDILL